MGGRGPALTYDDDAAEIDHRIDRPLIGLGATLPPH